MPFFRTLSQIRHESVSPLSEQKKSSYASPMNRSVALINACIKHGQKLSGVENAPKFLKDFGLYNDLYNHFEFVRNYFIRENADLCYHDLFKVTQNALTENDFSLIIGGDHSLSLATIPAVLQKHPDLKILWIDAHADMNTPETSPSGHLHGMPLAALSGLFDLRQKFLDFPWIESFIPPENIFLLGTRDIDSGEKLILQNNPFNIYSYADVEKQGLSSILTKLKTEIGTSPLLVSFDVDSVNPSLAPATGVPVESGFNLQDVVQMAQFLGKMNTVALEIVEFNPEVSNTFGAEITANALMYFLRAFLKNHTTQHITPATAINL